MTNTPETDNLARGNHVVPTEFAQDLERRLAELEKRFRDKCMKETRLQCQIDERWGMRRELEAALGVTAGMENDESLRAGLQAIKKLQNERDVALGWAEAAWAKSDRAEKMLRTAAAKADEAQADYERVCRALAAAKADEWRECADGLASALHQMRDIPDYAEFALTQFERLKESQP